MTKKRFFAILCVVLALVGVMSVNAQAGMTVTLNQNVNIRTAPSVDAELVQLARAGQAFSVDGRTQTGEWVRGISQTGAIGWMVNGPTGLTRGQLTSLPVVNVNTPFTLSAPAGGAAPAPAADQPAARSTAPGGFSYGGHMSALDSTAFGWMQRAGMTWVKKQVRYSDGQSANDFAGWINTAHANGFRILLGVVGDRNAINNPGYLTATRNSTPG